MESDKTKKRPGIRRLTTICDCSRVLAKCIKEFYNGELPEDTLRAMAYSLSKLTGMIKAGELEDRLEELEAQITAMEKAR